MPKTNKFPSIRVGEVRPSQLMFTYGVGALIDLPKLSVIVTGLDDWPANPEYSRLVNESRLLQAVQFHLPAVEKLLAPPIVPETGASPDPSDPVSYIGVPVAAFPRWMVCPSCRILAPISSGLFELDENFYRMDETCYRHTSCNKARNPEVIPARFLVACEKGHLDDFPWVEFVHRGEPCATPMLRLIEHGPSGEARDLEVRCDNLECNAQRRLTEAFGIENRDKMPDCRGRRPHLRDYDSQACGLKMRTIILGASNTWFPAALSAIGIPASVDIIMQLLEENWAVLKNATSAAIIAFMRSVGQLGRLSLYSDERIFDAIQQRLHDLATGSIQRSKPDLKGPEW
ncbi:MAG: DrmB family protein, partial [Chloroflexota bacterium]